MLRRKEKLPNNKPVLLSSVNLVDQKKLSQIRKRFRPKLIDLAPYHKQESLELYQLGKNKINKSVTGEFYWVWYPWLNQLVKLPSRQEFKYLRLSRNRNLVTEKEQQQFAKIKVGIAGMNIGYHAALCLALEGGAEYMKLADPDFVTLSSLNRFKARLIDVGENKAVITARQVYELDPFYQLEIYQSGIAKQNIRSFLTQPKINVLIEEMDQLPLKIEIRRLAKKYRIPVIMVTGNGSDVILDVERYDSNANLPLLNGLTKPGVIDRIKKISSQKLSPREKGELAKDFLNVRRLAQRLEESFSGLGRTLPAIPQLAETSFLRGAVLSFAARQLALKRRLPSGRYFLEMEKIFS